MISILLVEDDLLIQKVGKAILAHCGCSVDVAGNGREAVEAFARQRYDMILMDCQMPGMAPVTKRPPRAGCGKARTGWGPQSPAFRSWP